jgi:cytochrome-b5 reductase
MSQNWLAIAGGSLLAGTLAWQFLGRSTPPPSSPANVPTSASTEGDTDKANGAKMGARVAFTGGDQGFLSLVLDKVETVNHNTKKFMFKLPEEDMVSGLHVASALLTKYKGPEMDKPVIRPYTPINNEGGAHLPPTHIQTHTHTEHENMALNPC